MFNGGGGAMRGMIGKASPVKIQKNHSSFGVKNSSAAIKRVNALKKAIKVGVIVVVVVVVVVLVVVD